jgi:hypothetical protein
LTEPKAPAVEVTACTQGEQLFWSGRSFEEGLKVEGSFKAAEARYTAADRVDTADLARWLAKAREIQWDYRNLVRRRGRLERLK